MTRRNRPTLAQVDEILRQLKEAQASLRIFLDPTDGMCAIPPSVREAANQWNYLSSWVDGPLAIGVDRLECALEGVPRQPWDDED